MILNNHRPAILGRKAQLHKLVEFMLLLWFWGDRGAGIHYARVRSLQASAPSIEMGWRLPLKNRYIVIRLRAWRNWQTRKT